jgi:hypothetical protein
MIDDITAHTRVLAGKKFQYRDPGRMSQRFRQIGNAVLALAK